MPDPHPKRFFIVFSPEGETPPVKVHATHKEAFSAAHMMAKRHPGRSFFVMKSSSRPIVAEAKQEVTANV